MVDHQPGTEYQLTETPAPPMTASEAVNASEAYIGRWNRLVSMTNWEKGRIITQWRQSLADREAPPAEFSDDAWARLVGGVTAQHVGRLRRVYGRFSSVYDEYDGLFWSHFYAALDWNDAEMWLEGAVQNGWTVADMRRKRWETLSGDPADAPQEKDAVSGEIDEDHESGLNQRPEPQDGTTAARSADKSSSGPLAEGPDFGEEPAGKKSPPAKGENGNGNGANVYSGDQPEETVEFVRPFENVGELPDDLAEAFEAFKLVILRYKAEDWQTISRDEMLIVLDSLKELALAPSAEKAPF